MAETSRQKSFRIIALALAVLGMASNAPANGSCRKTRDADPLRVAAIQQQLMVAALICHRTQSYNRFVLTYRRDLQRSDAALLEYFQHRERRRGTAAYHAYKTRLANDASLRSAHNPGGYCADAARVFDTALAGNRMAFAELVATQSAGGRDPRTCSGRARVAGGR